jgi:hypothetical protein
METLDAPASALGVEEDVADAARIDEITPIYRGQRSNRR